MAYNYLLELYETIASRRGEAQRGGVERGDEAVDRARRRGRVEALDDLERFLRAQYHPRLPRRIRARFEGAAKDSEAVPPMDPALTSG